MNFNNMVNSTPNPLKRKGSPRLPSCPPPFKYRFISIKLNKEYHVPIPIKLYNKYNTDNSKIN